MSPKSLPRGLELAGAWALVSVAVLGLVRCGGGAADADGPGSLRDATADRPTDGLPPEVGAPSDRGVAPETGADATLDAGDDTTGVAEAAGDAGSDTADAGDAPDGEAARDAGREDAKGVRDARPDVDASACQGTLFGSAAKYGLGELALTVGDVNGDGFPDLISTRYGITAYINDGHGAFSSTIMTTVPDVYAVSLSSVDLNGDGFDDLILNGSACPAPPCTMGWPSGESVMLSNGDGTFRPPTFFQLPYVSLQAAPVDLNGDGLVDVVATLNSHSVAVLLGNGDGTFRAPSTQPTGTMAFYGFISIGDFNGDGHPDVVIAPAAANFVAIMIGDGAGSLALPQPVLLGDDFYISQVSVADVNGDGVDDVLTGMFRTISVLYGRGAGDFANPLLLKGRTAQSVVAADFNGDGVVDLGVTCLRDSACVLLGTSRGPKLQGIYPLGPEVHEMFARDVNGDGLADLVVDSNYGPFVLLNTGCRSSADDGG